MKKTLRTKVKEAVHRYSLFGKIEEVANRRRHRFHEDIEPAVERITGARKELDNADTPLEQRNAREVLGLAEMALRTAQKKRDFWRRRYVWSRERHQHWGTVLKHRRDRIRAWAAQHEGFQPYMANGNPYEHLTDEAKHGIYLDFKEGLYCTSTYEGFPGDGVHSTSSYHYLPNQPDGKGRCWDSGAGTLKPMEEAQERQAREWGPWLTEMFGPINDLCFKNGVRISLAEGTSLEQMHDNHKHTDLRDGAPA